MRILIVEDNMILSGMIEKWLHKAGYEVLTAIDEPSARSILKKNEISLVLGDVRLPEGDGISLLEWMMRSSMEIPFIVMTDYACISDAVRAIKLGAKDYLEKPVHQEQLLELMHSMMKSPVVVRKERSFVERTSEGARKAASLARRVAPSELSVLILGPSGSGKEVIAQMIHRYSDRREKSSDGKTIYTMLEKMIKGRNISISMLRIDYLTRAETIDFFDQLAQEGLGENWEIEDIKRITLKQNAGNTDDSSENEKEATPEQLSGITQAILEGKNLRENNFVKQAEESGYAFTSMTYIFFNPKETKKVELRAEFKGNPKMFEVCLETYLEPSLDSNGEYEESLSHLSDNDNINIRSTFWNNAKKIYNTLIKHQKENGV